MKVINGYSSLRMIRYGLNTKIVHFLRVLPPNFTSDLARNFDTVIMGCIGSLIHFDPIDEKLIHEYDPQHCIIQLENGLLPASLRTLIAQLQVRRSEASGGFGLTSMEAIQAPAFYSATFRFFRSEKMLTFFADNPDNASTSHSQYLTTWFRDVSLHLHDDRLYS